MILLNKKGYDPIDDDSPTGYRRPPREPSCVCDYFATLMEIEDGGKFMHKETDELLNDPDLFFFTGRVGT